MSSHDVASNTHLPLHDGLHVERGGLHEREGALRRHVAGDVYGLATGAPGVAQQGCWAGTLRVVRITMGRGTRDRGAGRGTRDAVRGAR